MDEAQCEWMQGAATAYRRFADLAAAADPGLPSGLTGWCLGDLVEHVAWGAGMEAAAVRSAAGLAEPDTAGGSLLDAVLAFERVAAVPVDPSAPIELSAGTVPMAQAAPLFAFEAAVHALDLEYALGGAPRFTDLELAACEVVLGPMLDLVAATVPEEGTVIDLLGLGAGIRLRSEAGAWCRGVPDTGVATTTVSGDAQDLLLFACGRKDASTLRVHGALAHVDRFKTYFPGP